MGNAALFAHGEVEFGPGAFAPGAIAVGALVRAAEALLDAGPYLLVGALVAAVVRGMVGGEALRRSFQPGFRGAARAAGLGLLLPLCALGVLPVVREFRRAGVPPGPTVSFALSAALNPLSLVYGMTLLDPPFLAGLVLVHFAMSVGVGAFLDRRTTATPGTPEIPPEALPATGGRRLALAALAFTRAWLGLPAFCLLVGVLGAGLVAGVLPHGLFQSSMTRQNPWAPAVMALVGTPEYATPLTGMMQAGTLVRDGFSAGAAWLVLALGAGVNLGTFAWFARGYGRAAALRLAGLLLGVNLLVGYAAHLLLPSPVTPPDHTHALDGLARPSAAAGGLARAGAAFAPLRDRFLGVEALPLAALVAASLVGVVFRRVGVGVGPGVTSTAEEKPVATSVWNRPIPVRWLRLIAVCAAVLVAARLLYVFYPPPAALFDEMSDARVELSGPLRPQDREANLAHLRRFADLARKLPVSVALRQGGLTPGQRAAADELVECLGAVRESIEAGRQEEAAALLRYLKDVYEACRRAYPTDPK